MTAEQSTPENNALRIGAGILLMMAVWLLWSGYFKPLLISLGFVSCCIVMLLSWRMGNLEQENAWQRRLLRFPRYWLWLGWELVKSNLEVARIILSPRLRVSPTLVTVDAETTEEFAQAMLGNSITLTPGTLTLEIKQGRVRVHCLTREGAVALAHGEMNRRVAALMKP